MANILAKFNELIKVRFSKKKWGRIAENNIHSFAKQTNQTWDFELFGPDLIEK